MACFLDFKDAVALFMDSADAKALLDDVKTRAEGRLRKRYKSRAAAYNKSVDEILEERARNVKKARLQSLMNVVKFQDAVEQVRGFKNKARGTNAFFSGVESNIKRSRESLDAGVHAAEFRINSYFLTRLDRDGVTDYFNTTKNGLNIAKEIDTPGSTGDVLAQKTAAIINDINKYGVKLLNEQGADIAVVDDHIAKLVHNVRSMKSATGNGIQDAYLKGSLMIKHRGNYATMIEEYKERAFDRWKNTIVPLTDEERTLENVAVEDTDKFWKSFYTAVTTGVHKVPYDTGGSPFLVRAGSNLANKLSAKRIWFAKRGGESWFKYNKDYGYSNVHDAVVTQYEQMGKSLGIMKKLGTSPANFTARLIQKMRDESQGQTDAKKFLARAQNTAKYILGDRDIVSDGLAGHILNVFRIIQYISKTGNITLSSLPDFAIMQSALRQHGIPASKVYQEAIGNLIKGLPKGELKQVLLNLRLYADGSFGGLMQRFGAQDTFYGNWAKAMRLQERLTGLTRFDNTGRATMGILLSNNLAQQLKKTFFELEEPERRTLEISGIDEKIWKTLQANQDKLVIADRQKFLTPEISDELSEESIAEHLFENKTKEVSAVKLARARELINDRLSLYFTDQSAYGKIMPTSSDIAFMNMGINTKSFPGRVWQLMTMFKSFQVASTRRTLGRFVYGKGAESVYEAFIGGQADFKGMGNYMIHALPWGYLSYASKLVAAGFVLPDPRDPKTIIESMNQGGVTFMYGSQLTDIFNSQHDFLISQLGPGVRSIGDFMALTIRLLEGKKSAKQIDWLVESNLPLIHTFYAKAVLNHTILKSIHKAVDPMYEYNAIKRANARGLHYMWGP